MLAGGVKGVPREEDSHRPDGRPPGTHSECLCETQEADDPSTTVAATTADAVSGV